MSSNLNNFPALIELQVFVGDKWEVMLSHLCYNKESLYRKMEVIKTMYVLKKYRIFVTYQSKLNRYADKKGDV